MGDEAAAFTVLQASEPVDAVVRVLTGPAALRGMAHASLGLGDLPSRIGRLADGMVYGLACEQQSLRLPILAGALAATLESGKQCALITPADPGMLLRKARLAGFALETPLKEGRLAVFQVAGDAAKHLFRIGVEGFLAQLQRMFSHREAFVVLDHADPLFMLSDPGTAAEAAKSHLAWSASQGHTLLALFAPAAHAAREFLALRLVAENFGGFAIAKPSHGAPVLEIRHWFGAEGASARHSFALRWAGTASLGVEPAPRALDHGELTPAESVIWAEDAGAISDALDAACSSEAATLVLPFQRAADYPIVCRAVAAVRAHARPSLRVVVRERGFRVRAAQALALLRLGASSIIPAGLSDTAARRIVDALQGTRFTRPYDTSVEEVEAQTRTLVSGAANSAASFCDAVEGLVAAGDGFEIESCLVRLELDQAEASRALALVRRLGRELVALPRGNCLWLFLFGCPGSLAPAVLRRLFIAPLAEFCSSWSTEHDAGRILMELRSLRDS
jgi:hypothetical protein